MIAAIPSRGNHFVDISMLFSAKNLSFRRGENGWDVFDVVRNSWVIANPEEIIRQQLILHMINDCRYPKKLIIVEKSLKECSMLNDFGGEEAVECRRFDIMCLVSCDAGLKPLLLVECKSGAIERAAWDQLIGYNCYVKSPFVACVNESGIFIAKCKGDKKLEFLERGLAFYDYLVEKSQEGEC